MIHIVIPRASTEENNARKHSKKKKEKPKEELEYLKYV